jgi:hypothetical protein
MDHKVFRFIRRLLSLSHLQCWRWHSALRAGSDPGWDPPRIASKLCRLNAELLFPLNAPKH